MVPTNPPSTTCILCQAFDVNCESCVTGERKCAKCSTPNMYPDDISHICVSCSTTCGGSCDATNGICTTCQDNYVFQSTRSRVCESCSIFDAHCAKCSSAFDRKCVMCNTGYYPDEIGCLACKDPQYVALSGFCSNCEIGTYKKTETACESCYFATENCNVCSTLTVAVSNCTSCMINYVLNGGKCQLCPSGKYYNLNSKSCLSNDVNCQIQVDKSKCLLRNSNYFLANGICQQTTRCHSPSNITMFSCDCYDQISVNSDCQDKMVNCKYQKVKKNNFICINCNDNFTLNGNECQISQQNMEIRNGIIYKCGVGDYLDISNECVNCGVSVSVCQLSRTKVMPLKCYTDYVFDTTSNQCVTDENCQTAKYGFCTKCASDFNYASQGRCLQCQTNNCGLCDSNSCLKCLDGFVRYTDTWCISKSEISTCKTFSSSGCVVCNEGYYQTDSKNVENKYDYCIPIESTTVTNCKRYNAKNNKCVECLDAFKMKSGICAESFDEDDKLKTSSKTATETTCLIRNNKGCQHCADGYYNINNECLQCENDCLFCYNTTYCTTCRSGFYLSADMSCKSLGALQESCDIALPGGGGCAICNSGYYREGISCTPCDESCALCVNSNECLACKDGYFNIPSECKLCQPNTTLSNCEFSSSSGCERCMSGHYLSNYKCYECSSNCISCDTESVCTKCDEKEYVLVNFKCIHFTKVEHCVSAQKSKCVKCEGRREPTYSGDSCTDSVNYGVVIGIPITVVVLLILTITLLIVILFYILQRYSHKQQMQNVCVFDIKSSNLTMEKMNDVLCSNKNVLRFDIDSDEVIKVDTETRDLICIGNTSKHSLKVQFSVIEGCDCYQIGTLPSIVTLKQGKACEFELFIKPLCSCQIKENILVIALDIVTKTVLSNKLQIEVDTEQSTKLNYRELEETKQIGEGSFGIVYKGNYRGNVVAIKKMKQSDNKEETISEFRNEVDMLDKFWNEYIVHFFGAVLIPNKICMVTEFAQYGSFQDLINKKKSNEVEMHLRIKFILDASKGIEYLHENGILHRDIKPDNILVISLDINEKVNAKLTDFGSARISTC
ncbi:protein serine/threonine kinase, putative [Entamoeba invadens IP1]|uniref:Protein serine/threonine kinase, putative n=1 Tax=Entamoeba invadens IP1 TaxID=370355 RepID=L7FM51_ENTIV|nr:protein serine/threonine kinase, putative [Entamoeba invadens IP1]ELP85515.1 protein serine/threonine kinase, putative [Entamoeba invadens IP1]|eukprot:XP_004184861.1 protein serine/threonine kinase, putative [Entamoeba invadens IP1]